jgi:hypothetical protein
VLFEALLDLARLLVGMDVQRQLVLGRIPTQLLEPVTRARADGVGGDADVDPAGPQLLELAEVRGHRLLAEALDAAARVGDVEEDELDSGFHGRLGRRASLLEPEVVELADRGVPGGAELAVEGGVLAPDALRRLPGGDLQHRLPPSPEVAALDPSPQRALEGMAMRVDEARDPRRLWHARILSTWRLQPSRRRSRSYRMR